ncbi:hypothetical protein D7V83_01935 [bacterium 0.1xD8-71]|nr:hypothetical protein D7V83_01935 [bacterium 0.1xD8-71]
MTKPVSPLRIRPKKQRSIRVVSLNITYNRYDEEENSTDRERDRERIMGGRSLREIFGTGLGVLCDEHSAAPAITVREESAEALIRVVPPRFRPLWGRDLGVFYCTDP